MDSKRGSGGWLVSSGDTTAAFVHPLACVVGDVELADGVFVLPFAVLRGDNDTIRVGRDSNIQDGAILHADAGVPCTLGARVTVGHRAIVHGATVEDECMIGIGAIVLNRVVIGRGSVIGAGSVVPEGTAVPPNSLVLGVPARVVGDVASDLQARVSAGVDTYCRLREWHRKQVTLPD
ncbi:MAG: Protein YrdA [Gemmatimonadaceae bacterium]|nr:Protein YrdA [Gemmatimonadaceae bacterium]